MDIKDKLKYTVYKPYVTKVYTRRSMNAIIRILEALIEKGYVNKSNIPEDEGVLDVLEKLSNRGMVRLSLDRWKVPQFTCVDDEYVDDKNIKIKLGQQLVNWRTKLKDYDRMVDDLAAVKKDAKDTKKAAFEEVLAEFDKLCTDDNKSRLELAKARLSTWLWQYYKFKP